MEKRGSADPADASRASVHSASRPSGFAKTGEFPEDVASPMVLGVLLAAELNAVCLCS